ncbi:hypothetical protein BT67DRAFT_127805 [Trichocladium antarcticum]|uniref:Secreted protein n=1 Tax=Trichocladium antarcticum TaxID=1450529 RepID=A0AAN6URQ9_9PEZI|nr:hypothetical protein BT67DRAFT_127805 [Trichocladium antarcticum]
MIWIRMLAYRVRICLCYQPHAVASCPSSSRPPTGERRRKQCVIVGVVRGIVASKNEYAFAPSLKTPGQRTTERAYRLTRALALSPQPMEAGIGSREHRSGRCRSSRFAGV